MIKHRHKKAFTLIELIVVIAILAILTAIAIPAVGNIIERARIASDQATVATLNTVTGIFKVANPKQNQFYDKSKSSESLMNILVSSQYLNEFQKAKSKDASFKWLFNKQKWHLLFKDSFYVVSSSDNLLIGSGGHLGYLKGSYSGDSKDIVIPITFDGTTVTQIYQDSFDKKGLLAVSFEDESKVTRIHARAFQNNKISTIELPVGILRIDFAAFMNNNLTEVKLPSELQIIEGKAFDGNNLVQITIGANVKEIKDNAFGKETDLFKQSYKNGGEGTYNFIDGKWVKSTT